jgi:NAD-dependent DNA ligase
MTSSNQQISIILDQLSNMMSKQGEPFKAKAYNSAKEAINKFPLKIHSILQLKDVPNIGKSCLQVIDEFLKTGKVQVLEDNKNNPINLFADIYGVGPKKAKELVEQHKIFTINQLRENQTEVLNNIQQVGLKYYEDILQRIPRAEIDHYSKLFEKVANTQPGLSFEIVGSYRRGAQDSGDIDVILTAPKEANYIAFIELLIKSRIIIEVLSRGKSKCLVISQLPSIKTGTNINSNHVARRVDFLFCSKEEYPFSLLYFTGSKLFNTNMRAHALTLGYSMNEHGLTKTATNQTTSSGIATLNPTASGIAEKDIFTFLNLEYVSPKERNSGNLIYINKGLKETKEETYALDYQKGGLSFLKTLSQEEIKQMILYAEKTYHNEETIYTDNEYDIMVEYYQKKFNIVLTNVGAPISSKSKVLLPYEMWSMDKIKPDTNALQEWKKKYTNTSTNPSSYLISSKLDGVSGLLCYKNGRINLYTRGDGKIGQDISHLIPYLRLPELTDLTSGQSLVIRGEFIIQKKVFKEKYEKEFANPRNFTAGQINRIDPDKEKMKEIDFVCYEVIEPFNLYPSTQLVLLKTYQFKTVFSVTITGEQLSNENLSKLLIELREKSFYEIDGLICAHDKVYPRTSGNPAHAFAFKMVLQEQMAEAKVIDVIWSASKDGYMKPRVQIEPLVLGGVTISYATGFNASFIQKNKIGLGAVISLIRSGDVIPHIQSITMSASNPIMPPNYPDGYKWTESGVDLILIDLSADSEVREKNITNFFKKIEVDGLGQGNISRLIAAGYDTIAKICQMKQDDFLNVEGFAEKMAKKIYAGIQSQLATTPLHKLMVATNIFGRGFSDGKIASILEICPNILTGPTNQPPLIKGISEKSMQEFIQHIPEFIKFTKDCNIATTKTEHNPLLEKVEQNQGQNQSTITATATASAIAIYSPKFPKSSIEGKVIVLTGFRDKNFIEYIEKNGGKIGSAVTKKTDFVIAKDSNESSSKIDEAKRLGIPIIHFL